MNRKEFGMDSKCQNLTRRKFIMASSVAVASPFIAKNILGTVSKAEGAEAAEEEISYHISDTCIGCHYCFNECPESAIHWGNDKYMIDQDKCVQCGTCAEVCNIGAAHRQVVIDPWAL